MNLKISGIYQIRNTGNDRKYIAASEDINKSIKKDFLLLKTKKHKCKQLQDEWNVQTSSSFVFEIVKQNVETAKLIDELNKNLEISKNCIYDIQSIEKREKVESAGMFSKDDVFNIRNEYKNGNVTTYDLAEKWKTRQSNIVSILHNATYYDPGYVFEKQEIIRKSSNLDWEKVKNIRSLYGNSIISMDDLAKMFQTSTPTVCKIINNVSWVDLNYHKSNISKTQKPEIKKELSTNNSGKKLTLDLFIKNANERHSNFYDYSLIKEYINTIQYVDIICPTHGVFTQKINSHLKGQGCKICGYVTRGNKISGKI